MREDVTPQRRRRFGLDSVRAVGGEHVGGDRRVRRVEPAAGAQPVVGVERTRGLGGDVGLVELVHGHVGEPDPGHPGLGSRGELEPSGHPWSVPRAQRGHVDRVLPLVPRRLVTHPGALRVHEEEPAGHHEPRTVVPVVR